MAKADDIAGFPAGPGKEAILVQSRTFAAGFAAALAAWAEIRCAAEETVRELLQRRLLLT